MKYFNHDDITIGDLLGSGQFNDVYEAHMSSSSSTMSLSSDEDEDNDFVLKQLRTNTSTKKSAEYRIGARDLAQEAETLSSIVHENIIKFHGVFTDGGNSLVLEKLHCTLSERIKSWQEEESAYKKGVFPRKYPSLGNSKYQEMFLERLQVAFGIAEGLKYLHEYNIMHRDLKPDNIGFDYLGEVKIFDFGLAKKLQLKTERRPTGLVGTMRYMAPEIAKCKIYGLEADIYSYGILLWGILTLRQPFGKLKKREFQEKVLYGNLRPKISSSWSELLISLMKRC